MISPVQSQEHVGGKSHLVLKKYSKYIGKCWQENLVKGVHHEQGDVQENYSWVAFEKWGAVLHAGCLQHERCWQSFRIEKFFEYNQMENLVIEGFIW